MGELHLSTPSGRKTDPFGAPYITAPVVISCFEPVVGLPGLWKTQTHKARRDDKTNALA